LKQSYFVVQRRPATSGEQGGEAPPAKFFAPTPGKMCWT